MAVSKRNLRSRVSVKHLQIDKSQTTVLIVIAAAVALSIFGLFATKVLISKGLYQRRVLNEKRTVSKQLQDNVESANKLFSQYQVFADASPNILGGNKEGDTNLDGDNPRIVLDSLPSIYDAPALASSLEKILSGRSVTIDSITVTDDPSATDEPEAKPQAKTATFSFNGKTSISNAPKLFGDFERSIRPFDVNKLVISGTDEELTLIVDLTTYYQPAKSLDLQPTKEVK